jgi:autotransporter-associated beta strand protein
VITGGEVAVTMAVSAKYVRFTPILNRNNSAGGDIQYSEFELWFGGAKIAWPSGTTATIPDGTGFNNWKEGPTMIIDGDVNTKFYWGPRIIPITIVMPESVSFDEYRWYTANDANWRDPTSWKVETSLDGMAWTTVDERSAQTITTDREALAADCKIGTVNGKLNAVSDNSVLTLAAPGTLSVRGATETVGPLNGNGTLALSAATVAVDTTKADAAFSGAVTGTGVFAKTGTGTLAVSGAWNFSGTLIVENGILDVTGADLGGVTNIVLKGGSIIGIATVSGGLTVSSEGGSYGASISVGGALRLSGAMTLDNSNAAYPLRRTCFTFASADDASRAIFMEAAFSATLPKGMDAFRSMTATSMKLAIAYGGTNLILR